jgi:hypothetical protein
MVLSPFRPEAKQTACIIKGDETIDFQKKPDLFRSLNAPAFWKKRCKDKN